MEFSAPSPDNRVTRLAIFRQTAEKCHKNELVHRCGTASRVAIPCEQVLCCALSLSPCKNKPEKRLVCVEFCPLIHFCDKKAACKRKEGRIEPPSAQSTRIAAAVRGVIWKRSLCGELKQVGGRQRAFREANGFPQGGASNSWNCWLAGQRGTLDDTITASASFAMRTGMPSPFCNG